MPTPRHLDPRHPLRAKHNARGYVGARDVVAAIFGALVALAATAPTWLDRVAP